MPSFTFSQSHLVAGTVSLPGLMFDIQVSQIHAAYPKRSEEDGSYVKQKPAHSWYDLLLLGIHLRWQLQCVKCETQGPWLISVPKPHVGQRNMMDVTKLYLSTDEHRATKSTSWYQIWLPQIRAGTPVSSWSCLHPADRRENCKSSSSNDKNEMMTWRYSRWHALDFSHFIAFYTERAPSSSLWLKSTVLAQMSMLW